jgi:hypothetical protein
MTLMELEQRLMALEKVVRELKDKPPAEAHTVYAGEEHRSGSTDDLIPGAEYDLVPDVPPIEEMIVWGRIVSIEDGEHGLGLSPSEWDSLLLEDDHA